MHWQNDGARITKARVSARCKHSYAKDHPPPHLSQVFSGIFRHCWLTPQHDAFVVAYDKPLDAFLRFDALQSFFDSRLEKQNTLLAIEKREPRVCGVLTMESNQKRQGSVSLRSREQSEFLNFKEKFEYILV
jgi:hypothetical protein